MARYRPLAQDARVISAVRQLVQEGESDELIAETVASDFPWFNQRRLPGILRRERRIHRILEFLETANRSRRADLAAVGGCPEGTTMVRVRATIYIGEKAFDHTATVPAVRRLRDTLLEIVETVREEALRRNYQPREAEWYVERGRNPATGGPRLEINYIDCEF